MSDRCGRQQCNAKLTFTVREGHTIAQCEPCELNKKGVCRRCRVRTTGYSPARPTNGSIPPFYCETCRVATKSQKQTSEEYKERRKKFPSYKHKRRGGVYVNDALTRLVRAAKMRSYRERKRNGEPPKFRMLTAPQVRAIKKMLRSGEYTHQQLADAYGVTRSTITKINTGASHKLGAPIRPPKNESEQHLRSERGTS